MSARRKRGAKASAASTTRDVHLVNHHGPSLDRNFSFPSPIGTLVLQHLGDMAHNDLGIFILGRLHACLDDTRHARGPGERRGV